jgi:glycosyltransferase involved in cell wall biosynthesis
LRIAFFTETFLPATDGVVRRLRHTIEELLAMGDEMLVIAPKYGEGPGSYEGVPIHRVSSVPFPPYPQIKLAPINPGVGTALRRFEPELIHAVNPFVLGRGAPFYSRRLNVPLVASYHTNIAAYASFYGLGFFDRATLWYTRTLHNRAAINLCTSEATRRYLSEQGIERLHLWPQGVDAKHFHPDKFSKDWRVRLTNGHPADRLLLYVGRLGHEKDIGRLRIVLTGALQGEELAAAFASADAFLFPSTTETLGMAMIEALASGLPVIAARTGATGEVVSDGETGLLYDPHSDAALVAAVRKLVSDDGLRAQMGRKARVAAEGRDWRSSTRTLRGYYEQAMGER